MAVLMEYWDQIILILMVGLWMYAWRMENKASQERSKENQEHIIAAIEDLRTQMSSEHRGVSKAIQHMDEHTISEHQRITEALVAVKTSLMHLIDDTREGRKTR